ncbi:hypothetical protein H310_11204 [Aphanomyces invadans]|uniref:FYVE-type domain-containing protein n=1 Tax=Aphanomyces invadans TaxID=157072 RepID=A0A024TMS5_9STRA|nr:hypothetical protein H310_11204 [Aphanomyces invadans]ETV95304.1 hypothetical protein H310_11204 [Aphanomyces invadans]|eukprot:XP_008876005.1 hypothetical protein H310_11204 [Aphanomyces invadans]
MRGCHDARVAVIFHLRRRRMPHDASMTMSKSTSFVLDEDQYRKWKYQLRDTVVQAMQSSPASREADAKFEGYRLASSDRHAAVRVFKRKATQIKQHKRSPFVEVLSISTFDTMTLDDFAYIFHNASPAEHRNHMAMMYPHRFVDGAILNTTLSSCDEDPFLWFGVKSITMHLDLTVGNRCATYVEYSGTTADREGHKVLFVVRESFSAWSQSPQHFTFKEYFLLTQLHDFRVEGVHYYHADPKGAYPSFLFNKHAVQHGQILEHMPHFFRQKWLLAHPPQRPHHTSTIPVALCASCNASIIKAKPAKRHLCRACGHTVCTKCVVWASEASPHIGATKVAVCKKCYVAASQVLPYKRQLQLQSNIRLFDGAMSATATVAPNADDDSLRDNVAQDLLPVPAFREVPSASSSDKKAGGRESNLTCRTTAQSEDYVLSPSYEPSIVSCDSDDDDDLMASFIRVNQGLEAQKQLMHQMLRQFAKARPGFHGRP